MTMIELNQSLFGDKLTGRLHHQLDLPLKTTLCVDSAEMNTPGIDLALLIVPSCVAQREIKGI